MNLPADYHIHTKLCRHAVGEVEQYAGRAVEAGLKEIGFSDHAPMPEDDFDDWRMRFDQLESYVQSVIELRKKFPQLTIRLAIEIDYIPGCEKWTERLLSFYRWDYVIGSVHYVWNKWDIDNPNKKSEWEKHDVQEVWRAYFERLTRGVKTGLFNIIGHIDLPKKFGHIPKEDCAQLYKKLLIAARETNTAMEINTGGLRKDCKEMYPSKSILQMAKEEGVRITFGSDAHAPEEVAMNFADAVEIAKQCGYTEYCRFEDGSAIITPLF